MTINEEILIKELIEQHIKTNLTLDLCFNELLLFNELTNLLFEDFKGKKTFNIKGTLYICILNYNRINNFYNISISQGIFSKRKKNKFNKIEYKDKTKHRIINNIGINNAKLIHSEDKEIFEYILIEDFIKENQVPFSEVLLYELDNNGKYDFFRHKNLFSTFQDEISDFERYTYLIRNDKKILQLQQKTDSKVLDYDDSNKTIHQRKYARVIAKEIYHHKDGFTDKEIKNLFKHQAIFVKVTSLMAKELKENWNNITFDEMNIKTLEKEIFSSYKKRKDRRLKYYKTKKEIRRKERHQKYKLQGDLD